MFQSTKHYIQLRLMRLYVQIKIIFQSSLSYVSDYFSTHDKAIV